MILLLTYTVRNAADLMQLGKISKLDATCKLQQV